jgi:hypothetical protein
VPAVTADAVRILIGASNNVPALSNFGLYLASPDEPAAERTNG